MNEPLNNRALVRGKGDFNWIAVILTPLAVVLMEVLCFYPWLISAGKWSGLFPGTAPLNPGSAVILTASGLVCTRFFAGRRWPLPQIRLSVIACALVAIAAAAGIEYAMGRGAAGILPGSEVSRLIIAAVAGLYFWWRGMSWGLSEFGFDKIYRLFLLGLFALIALALIWGGIPGEGMPSLGFYIAGFFFCSLIALSLSKLQSIQEQLKARGKEAFAFSRRWASIVFTITGITVILGLAAASLFSVQFGTVLTGLLSKASDLLLQGLYYVFIPIGFLMNVLMDFLRFIISLLQTGQATQPAFSANLTAPADLTQIFNGALSPEVISIIKWSLLALLVAGVLYFLYRSIFRYAARKTTANADEIRESLWSWNTFITDLRLFLNISKRRLAGSRNILPHVNIFSRGRAREDNSGKLDIREIYRRLLAKAAEIKLARLQYETPLEYAGRLGAAIPEINPQLISLTDLYDSVRYGSIEPGYAQLEYANGAWKALRESLDKMSEKPDGNAK